MTYTLVLPFPEVNNSSRDFSIDTNLVSFLSLPYCKGLSKKGNVWRPNIIKHCLVTKHADVEVSGQTVKRCLIKHRMKLHPQRTMGHKLTHVTFSAQDFNMAERETS